jgi:hypothetical protein
MPLRSLLVDDDDAFLEAASVLLEREADRRKPGGRVPGEVGAVSAGERNTWIARA